MADIVLPQNLLSQPAGVLIKTTCVDFPGRLASAFFLRGCNLKCPYCYNIALVEPSAVTATTQNIPQFNTLQELFEHLQKRQGILTGLVISGGEPLLNPLTQHIVSFAKKTGYKIKLDTNGTIPSKLEEYLSNPELKPDFVAMDIKTSPARYAQELCKIKNSETASNSIQQALLKSINLLKQLSTEQREFRTVLVPALVTKNDIIEIAKLLPQDAKWRFAQFKNENCLNNEYTKLVPYSDSQITELINTAKTIIADSELR